MDFSLSDIIVKLIDKLFRSKSEPKTETPTEIQQPTSTIKNRKQVHIMGNINAKNVIMGDMHQTNYFN